ncbi:glutathione synthetase [Holotrichia oblita]|uniref:Glutathione synthetase n=1 Tax=Holotrichia oblita TaxID=644536 RepID=A0ACB9TIX5_HOLOL|nr:glutathione synthetase [Holotrichia oblita]
MHRVAHNREFLTKSLKETIQVDEFTGNLFKIYETVQDEGVIQPISLGLLRSDIMLETVCPTPGKNCPPNALYCCWKQVEINTIAGFRLAWSRICSNTKVIYCVIFVLQELDHHEMLANLPENNALEGLCSGMLEAWKIYGDAKAAILFIIEDVTYNICDQRFHEFELRRLNPYVKVIRRTLTDMAERAKLGPDNELLM